MNDTNTELERQIVSAMKIGINRVINGDKKEFKYYFISPSLIIDYLEKLGWHGELQTNGWQYDWWIIFSKEGEVQKYVANGSGYYGSFEFSR